MEFIQKKIKQIMTTGTTTGCTPCSIIIPDLNVIYFLKISLTAESQDIGFFDAYEIFTYGYGYGYISSDGVMNINGIFGMGESLLMDNDYI